MLKTQAPSPQALRQGSHCRPALLGHISRVPPSSHAFPLWRRRLPPARRWPPPGRPPERRQLVEGRPASSRRHSSWTDRNILQPEGTRPRTFRAPCPRTRWAAQGAACARPLMSPAPLAPASGELYWPIHLLRPPALAWPFAVAIAWCVDKLRPLMGAQSALGFVWGCWGVGLHSEGSTGAGLGGANQKQDGAASLSAAPSVLARPCFHVKPQGMV